MLPFLMAVSGITGFKLLAKNRRIATTPRCCCTITCCNFVGRTIHARICLTNCPCTGIPIGFTEIDFTLSWSGLNNRWEGLFAIPGCGTTMNVRLTYEQTSNPTECQFFWSDDACGEGWLDPPRQVDTTNCNITCDPFLWSVGLGGSDERYRGCCPGGEWLPGQGPGFVAYGFCDPADRTCNP